MPSLATPILEMRFTSVAAFICWKWMILRCPNFHNIGLILVAWDWYPFEQGWPEQARSRSCQANLVDRIGRVQDGWKVSANYALHGSLSHLCIWNAFDEGVRDQHGSTTRSLQMDLLDRIPYDDAAQSSWIPQGFFCSTHARYCLIYKFCQTVVDQWGAKLPKECTIKPHWAKEVSWIKLKNEHDKSVQFNDWVKSKAGYGDILPKFMDDLHQINLLGGVKDADAQRLFSNEFFDANFYPGIASQLWNQSS